MKRLSKKKRDEPKDYDAGLDSLLRVLQLAAIAAEIEDDKGHLCKAADYYDTWLRTPGTWQMRHPFLGDCRSARVLVDGIITWIGKFAEAKEDRRMFARFQPNVIHREGAR